MTWISVAALGLAAILILRYYFAYLRARSEECRELLSFLTELERGMRRSLETPSSVAKRFEAKRLGDSGFLSAISNGKSLSEAFDAAGDRMLLPETAKELLKRYFEGVGVGYLETELRELGRTIAELKTVADREREEISRRGKVAGVLLFSLVAGALLLLM